MKITKIEDLHCNAGWRNLSFLKIETELSPAVVMIAIFFSERGLVFATQGSSPKGGSSLLIR